MRRGPKPTVTHDGRIYTCRRWNVEVPNFDAMTAIEAQVWLLQNTIPTGVSRRPPEPNLRGLNLKVVS